MSTTRNAFVVVLLLQCVLVNAQHRYAEGYLKEGKEKVFNPEQTDNIGQVLLSGYLNGKLKAYSFMSRDSTAKFVVESRNLPKWKARERYYMDDWVEHNGIEYALVIDDDRSDRSPDKDPDKWVPISKLITVISNVRLLPQEKDTLPKSKFFQSMVISGAMSFDRWYSEYDYYAGDVVYYERYNYQAFEDNHNIIPTSDPNIWGRTTWGSPMIGFLRDASKVGVLYNYTLSGTDTLWNPQFVIAKLDDVERGYAKPIAYFKFDDAIRYLNTMPQPVPGSNEPGHAADFTFCINYGNSEKILDWLRERVKTNVKLVEKNVINAPVYQVWLGEETKKELTQKENTYQVMQNVASGELLLSKIDVGYEFVPFLRVTTKELKKLSKVESKLVVPSTNFGTAISDRGNFSTPSEAHAVDSLVPAHIASVKPIVRHQHFFVEQYVAKISDQKIVDLQAGKVWSAVCKAFDEKKLKESRFMWSDYNEHYEWAKAGKLEVDGYVFNPETFDLNAGDDPVVQKDSLPRNQELRELQVVYERNYPSVVDANKKFHPLFVAFSYGQEVDPTLMATASFDWAELKAMLGSNFKAFIDAVENGKLTFYRSEPVYGLRER